MTRSDSTVLVTGLWLDSTRSWLWLDKNDSDTSLLLLNKWLMKRFVWQQNRRQKVFGRGALHSEIWTNTTVL